MAKTFIRFNNVVIPEESVIARAFVVFTSYSSLDSIDANVKCYFANQDNPSAPSSKSDLDSRPLTSSVDWTNLQEWVDNRVYTTPDLRDILQTVMDREGWESGNSVLFIMEDDSSDTGSRREFSAIEFLSGAEKAELRLSWEPPRQIERVDFIPAPGAYSEDVDVELVAYPSGCSIYYTLDGSDPDENSYLYSSALPLITSEYNYHIRARAYKDHWLPSEIYDGYYFTTTIVKVEEIFDSGENRLRYVDIALDSNDVPHLFFGKLNPLVGVLGSYELYYINRIGGSWSPMELIRQIPYDGTYRQINRDMGIVIDSNDDPIVYWSENRESGIYNADFCRAKKSGGSWSLETPVSDLSSYLVLDFEYFIEEDDTEHVMFTDYTGVYPVRWFSRNPNTGNWSYGGQFSSNVDYDFVIDSNGYIHCVYGSNNLTSIYYRTNASGSWVTESWLHHPENEDIKIFGTFNIGLGIGDEVHIMWAGNEYHQEAACGGIHRFNSRIIRWYKDEEGTWVRRIYEDAGKKWDEAGDCRDNWYTALDMEMLPINAENNVPSFVGRWCSYSTCYVTLWRGYGANINIEGGYEEDESAECNAVDSDLNNHLAWVWENEDVTPNTYKLKYGTTAIEWREYL